MRPSSVDASARRLRLMTTCLCDLFYDDVARATVEVLEHFGCTVEVPEEQTCCGQPAFNAGDWDAARRDARHTLNVFSGDGAVVTPSGSCARMLSHGAGLLFEHQPDRDGVLSLGERSFELADFLVQKLGITAIGGRLERRVAFHRSCHGRGTSYAESALTLLGSIEGLSLVEVGEGEQCCGFGGTFTVTFPHVSKSMGELKLEHLRASEPDFVVSADMGCLMHLGGLAKKSGRPLAARHVAQIFRDALGLGAAEGGA
jgi:L-lactate dehydrogenase complex protein LldE